MPKKREILRRDINRNKFINKTKRKVKKKARWNSQNGGWIWTRKTGTTDKKVKRNPEEKSEKELDERGSKERGRGKRETNRKRDCCRGACVYKEGKIFGCG